MASSVNGSNASAIGSGAKAEGNNATAFGGKAKASAERATAIGQGAEAKAENSVALGQGSVATEENTVSVGNEQIKRRVTNVADGKNPNDAVNVKQLNEMQGSVDSVRKDLHKTDKRLRGGIAGATAAANIPQVTQPGSNLLGMGVGNFNGQSAVAVGYSRSSDNNKVLFKVSGAATTQGDFNVGAGIGYQWK